MGSEAVAPIGAGRWRVRPNRVFGWTLPQLVVVVAGVGLVAFTAVYPSLLTEHQPRQPLSSSEVIAAVGAVYLAVGIGAWRARPGNAVGPLMTAVGFGWLSFQLSWLPGTAAWEWQYVTNNLELPLLACLALVYPSGRLMFRFERVVIVLVWVFWTWGTLVNLLLDDPRTYCRSCPRNPLLVTSNPDLQGALMRPTNVATLVLAFGILGLLVVHWWRSTTRGRRSIGPIVLLSGPPVVQIAYYQIGQVSTLPLTAAVYPWLNLALITIPLGYAYTRLRDRWLRGSVGDLIVRLGSPSKPSDLQRVLARTLRDPTLVVAYWLPEEGRFADLDGHEVVLPQDGDGRRTATVLERDGAPLAVIVHDVAVTDDPKLMDAATAAASIAMENERLHALVRSQLDEVRASRARIVAAQDDERRRLERDLHDGAQQRLVTLALALGEARTRAGDGSDPALAAALDQAAIEVGAALAELRELAQGIHPAVLTRSGLVAAIQALGERAPIPVVVDAGDIGRLPSRVEATGYFLVSEALTNAAKHARASLATVRLELIAGLLRLEVRDDGVGGADGANGTGLRGLADRIRACDGQLSVESPTGGGTCIVAEIPCA